jgi:hypothetical protein
VSGDPAGRRSSSDGEPDWKRDGLAGILLASLKELAAAGRVETACRLAGRACVALRDSDPAVERSFNALLHQLSRRLDW